MDIAQFEKELNDLLAAGKFDQAEAIKLAATPWIKSALATDPDSAFLVLTLLSDYAGEAESFNHFSNLLKELQSDGLISEKQANELIHASPANRWL